MLSKDISGIKKTKHLSVWCLIFFIFFLTHSVYSEDTISKRENPFICLGKSTDLSEKMTTAEIKSEIKNRMKSLKPHDAHSLCVIADLMKRVGDYQSEDYYKRAIEVDDTEPAYELFYADYLRNFRGPQRPLFPEAEEHYYEVLRKLKKIEQAKYWQNFDYETKERVERGLATLYQEDGFPFFIGNMKLLNQKLLLKNLLYFLVQTTNMLNQQRILMK